MPRNARETNTGKIMKFVWVDGKESETAQLFGQTLMPLAGQGLLTPKAVVALAQAEDHPLHDFFEWDDTEAARKYRVIEAQRYIKNLEVVIETGSGPVQVKSFVSIFRQPEVEGEKPKENDRKYISVSSVRDDPVTREHVKQDLLKALRAWRDRVFKLQMQDDFAELMERLNGYLK